MTLQNPLLKLHSNILAIREKHHFHLVDFSQLPLTAAFASFVLAMNVSYYLHSADLSYLRTWDHTFFQSAWLFFGSVLISWFLVVMMEAGQGNQTITVRRNLIYGMILFIVSEVMFFFAFFWAFFHISLAPSMAIGGIWPPKSMQSLDVWGLPLVNTILLLSSGVTITLAHRAILQGLNYLWMEIFDKHLLVTVLLGISFLCCQAIEYQYGVTFRWKESVFGSAFFATTGFHGFHVTLGTVFLLFCLIRAVTTGSRFWTSSRLFIIFMHYYTRFSGVSWGLSDSKKLQDILGLYAFTKDQHFGFEASAWYWHFVDVVWIFLFISVYWWGT